MRQPPPFFALFTKMFFLKKLTALLLVFSFLIPALPLRAQEVSDSPAPPDESTPADTQSLIETSGDETVPVTDETPPTDDTAPTDETPPEDTPPPPDSLDSEADGTPFNEYEKQPVGFNLRAEPETVFGSMVYEYPLVLPPGRSRLEPNLKLVYSSQSSDITNPFEYGWSINIPYIERINKKGTDTLYLNYYFNSSIDGELYPNSVSTTTESYGPRNENGNFSKYEFKNRDYWLLTDKKGTTYKFGTSTNGRQDDSGDLTHVYRWMLQEVRDANNNYIQYEYFKDNGAIYPSRITYTGNNITAGIFTVDFLRESRNQSGRSYKTGFEVLAAYRIYEIDIKVSNTLVRKYVLSYSSADNANRRLIRTITETGQDDLANQLSLPATTFTYQTSTSTGWSLDSTFASPLDFVYVDFALQTSHDLGARVVDINGDGLPDVLSASTAYLNNGNGQGFTENVSWRAPGPLLGTNYTDSGLRFVDVNGDGLTDVLVGNANTPASGNIGTGFGWVASTTWTPPLMFVNEYGSGTGIYYDHGVRIADINGDGLPDFFYSLYGDPISTYLNNGNGWDATSTAMWAMPVYFTGLNVTDLGVRLVDINGDGMTDVMKALDGSHTTYINNGHGFGSDGNWASPVDFITSNKDTGVRFIDLNGDGLIDLFQSSETAISTYVNTGYGFTSTTTWNLPRQFTTTYGLDLGGRINDINGDGVSDILFGATSTESWINKSKPADLLITAVNSTGGQIDIEYRPSPFYTDSLAVVNVHLPMVLQTVRKITSSAGLGFTSFLSWIYGGGKYFFANAFDRRPSGFATTTKTDASGAYEKTYFHQGDSSVTTIGEYSDDQSKIGKVYRVENYDSSNNLYAKTINKWDKADLGFSRNFVKLNQSVSSNYDGNASHKDKAESYTYENTYGNLQQRVSYGEVTGSDDGTFSDTGSDLASTTIYYAASTTPYIVGLPYDELTQNQSLATVNEVRHYFDNLALGLVGVGNETKTENWIVSSTYASTTKVYDGTYGLVTQSRDPKGNLTTYTLDAKNLYPATTTNALSQVTGFVYDYASGKVKRTFDPNSRLYTTTYDAFRRPLTVNIPDPTSGALVTKSAYTYTDSGTPGSTIIQQTDYLSSATSTNTYTYLDGLGRNLQVRKQAEGGNYAVKDFSYNTLGLLSSESLPYFSSSSARTTASTNGSLFSFYSYDPLQRIYQTGTAVGTTTNSFDDWTVHITDVNGKLKDFSKDARGNLVTVVEHIGAVYATTSYAYDVVGNLTQIQDALSNVRNFTYDGLGRRLTAEDLHASGDATYGSWTYTFDVAGNLTTQLDPKSQTVNYTYDTLNRMLTEDYTGQAGTEVTYTYDSGTDGKGRLTTASSTDSRMNYTYNPLGLVKSEAVTINGTSTVFTTQYTYDRQNNQTSIIYPDLAQVNYNYNSAGLLDSMSEKEANQSSYTAIINNFDYAPTGQISTLGFGNGSVTTNIYDANALYRLSSKVTLLPNASKAQDLAYTYDSRGNITKIIDASDTASKKTVFYTYDDLSRLLTASSTNATTSPDYLQTFTYNVLGNMTSGPSGTYSYIGNTGSNYANPHAVTSILSSGGGSSIATSTIAFTASSTSITNGYNGGQVTKTWTHTVSGTSPLIILTADIWQDVAGTGSITSASWNGGAFTKATSTRGVGMRSEIWYLVASTTGSKTMSVTVTGATDAIKLSASSFTNTNQFAPLDASNGSFGSTGNPTISVTVGTGDVIVATLSRFSTTDATTSRTALFKDRTGSILGAASYVFSTTSGSYSDTYTGAASQDWSMVTAGFKPATTTISVGSTMAYIYDNNGNLTSSGTASATTTYTWDYRNQLTQSGTGSATSTYTYDHTGNRMKLTEAGVSTIFPNKFFNVSLGINATSTKHLFANNLLVATVENASSTTSLGGLSTSTPAYVQSKKETSTGTVTFNSSVTTGNLIVVGVTIWNTTIPANAITDNKGNTYTRIGETINPDTTDHAALFYAKNVTGGSSFAISSSVGGSIAAHEYSGLNTFAPLDKFASSTGDGTTASSGNITTATSSELYFGLAWSEGNSDTWTAGFGYTLREQETNNSSAERIATEDQVIATASTTPAKFITSNSHAWIAQIATFKPATTTSVGGSTSSSTLRYVATDQLSGSSVITDTTGAMVETLDYYPYGSARVDTKVGTYQGEKRKYAGTEADALSGLNYMMARYQDPVRGQFLSEDRMFLAVSPTLLSDPQQQNSYSYARNNPIIFSDPSGQLGELGGRFLPLTGAGVHQYYYWKPERPDLVNYAALGIPQGTPEFTMGFYNPGSGYLEAEIYYPGKEGASDGAKKDFEGHNLRRALGQTRTIEGLSAEREAGAINTMGQGMGSFDNKSVKYPSNLSVIFGTGVTSNSGNNTLSSIAGLGSQSSFFNPIGYSSGSNLFLPSNSFGNSNISQQISLVTQIYQLQVKVVELQRQLVQLQTGNAQSTPQTIH